MNVAILENSLIKMKHFWFLVFIAQVSFAQTTFEKGLKYLEQKKYAYAKSTFEWLIKENPKNIDAIDKLGEACFLMQEWDVAVKCGKKLVTADPQNAEYWFKYGGALGMKAKSVNKLKALGMIGDIREAFETSARLDSKHINVRWALVLFYMELPAIVGGSETKAQKYANELMQLSKVDGYLAKGYIDVYNGEYEKAEFYYKKAYEIGHSKTTYEKLYELYLNKMKNKEKAQKLKNDFY